MAQYLEKFRNTIGQRQGEQIVKLLNKKKTAGQIRSVDEFSRRLNDLIRDLTSTILTPSLKLFLGDKGDIITSETFNFMLDRVQDDLEAAFEEANNIDEVQKAHEAIIRDVVLKNLSAGVAELDSKIRLYEFINTNTQGFDSAIFSTFRESKEERTQRGTGNAILFSDRRTETFVKAEEDADVEIVGERLTLAPGGLGRRYHSIKSIRQIFDSESPQSDKVVERPGSLLSNVIDDTKGTYWIQTLLFLDEPQNIKVKLELDLGGVKETNFLEVEPISHKGVTLEKIQYLDNNNVVTDLTSPELLVEGPVGIRISKTATRRFIFTFRNDNPRIEDFQFTDQNTLIDQSFLARTDASQFVEEKLQAENVNMKALSDELDEMVRSEEVKEIAQISPRPKEAYSGVAFTTGFDNIRLGFVDHTSRSLYVSSPLDISLPSQIGIRVLESRPYHKPYALVPDSKVRFTDTTYDIADEDVYFLGSIEYWIVKQELTPEGILLDTTTFPILPLGVERIYHERLVLNQRSDNILIENDLGSTMFYATINDSNIKVYRNGQLLANVDGVIGATEGWRVYPQQVSSPHGDPTDRIPGSGSPMTFRMQILGGLRGDIYTVSYNPTVSSTTTIPRPPYNEFNSVGGLQVVDLVGDLSARRNSGQIVALTEGNSSNNSRVYLVIIMRQNTADTSLAPAVEEYTLMAGNKSSTKFEE